MIDVNAVLEPTRRAAGRALASRGAGPAVRDAREASAELRRAAREMRHAIERYPGSAAIVPGATLALADAARTLRGASAVTLDAGRRMAAAGVVADRLAELPVVGHRAWYERLPLVGRLLRRLRHRAWYEHLPLLGRLLGRLGHRAWYERLPLVGRLLRGPGRRAPLLGLDLASIPRLDLASVLRAGLRSVRHLDLDFGAVADVAVPVAAALGRKRPSRVARFSRIAVLLAIPVLLGAPLAAVLRRRRERRDEHGAWGTGGEAAGASAGATGALGIADPAVAADLLRSEGEGFSTGVAAPTVTALTVEAADRSAPGDPVASDGSGAFGRGFTPRPGTVSVPDATEPSAHGAPGGAEES